MINIKNMKKERSQPFKNMKEERRQLFKNMKKEVNCSKI